MSIPILSPSSSSSSSSNPTSLNPTSSSSSSSSSPSSSSPSSSSFSSRYEISPLERPYDKFQKLVPGTVFILTGTSAWWGSMPRIPIYNIMTHKDLDPYIPDQYKNVRLLTPEEEIQAASVSEVFKKVKEDTIRYGREFDQFVQQALGESPPSTSSGTLNLTGDRYLRAKIHESRHSAVIKNHLDSTSTFPTTYTQPKSEWWWV